MRVTDMELNQSQEVTAAAQLRGHHHGTTCCRNEMSTSHPLAWGSPNPADPKSKARKIKEPTALGTGACLLRLRCCTSPHELSFGQWNIIEYLLQWQKKVLQGIYPAE